MSVSFLWGYKWRENKIVPVLPIPEGQNEFWHVHILRKHTKLSWSDPVLFTLSSHSITCTLTHMLDCSHSSAIVSNSIETRPPYISYTLQGIFITSSHKLWPLTPKENVVQMMTFYYLSGPSTKCALGPISSFFFFLLFFFAAIHTWTWYIKLLLQLIYGHNVELLF